MEKRTKENLQIFSFVIGLILFFLSFIWIIFPHLHKWHIEQETRTSCCGSTNLVTYVWHWGEIVQSWYDPLESVNDSTKIKRRLEAKQLIENLNK